MKSLSSLLKENQSEECCSQDKWTMTLVHGQERKDLIDELRHTLGPSVSSAMGQEPRL